MLALSPFRGNLLSRAKYVTSEIMQEYENIYLRLSLGLESIWHCPFDFNFRVTNDMSFGLKGLIGFLNCTEGNKAKTTLIFYLKLFLKKKSK